MQKGSSMPAAGRRKQCTHGSYYVFISHLLVCSFLLISCSQPAVKASDDNDVTAGPPVKAQGVESIPVDPPGPQMVRDSWPHSIVEGDTTFLIYQPQVDKWEGNRLFVRTAVGVQKKSSAGRQFGVVWFSARTDVNKETRMVMLDDFTIIRSNFPTAADQGQDYSDALRTAFPRQPIGIALDRLQADLEVTQAINKSRVVKVNNTVPRIIFSTEPSLLILIDGNPVLRPVQDTQFMRVINTGVLLLSDRESNSYFLWMYNLWLQAPDLQGPWGAAAGPTASLNAVKQQAAADKKTDLMENVPPEVKLTLDEGGIPSIYMNTEPAYLVQTKGEPQFTTVPGTRLLSVQNSADDIFKDQNTWQYYLLISGRWFNALSLKGPWTFVAGKDLPADFAAIPADGPKGSVLTAVPGTPQARQAVIATTIPQTAAVSRTTKTSVTYDGPPQFKPIEGTTLQYAANASLPLICIDDTSYYLVENGVWFTGTSPNGPWSVATIVPSVIYTIPPSSPLHYVTYVYVYNSTPDVVYTGYTPGYNGAVVCTSDTVVYGTGYVYPTWAASVWFPPPPAYYYGYHDVEDAVHVTHDGKYVDRGYAGGTTFTQAGDATFARSGNDLYATKDGNVYKREAGGWKTYNPDSGTWELTNYSKAKDVNTIQDKRQGGSAAQTSAEDGGRFGSDDSARGDRSSREGSGAFQDRSSELEDSFRSRSEGERRFSDFSSRSAGDFGGRSGGAFGGGGFGGRSFGGGFGGRR